MPDIAPATGRVIKSIQLKAISLKPDRAEKIRKVKSIKNSPLSAPFSNPFCGDLKPMSTPMRIDKILIAIFTGIITLFATDAKRITMAKISTKASAMRVENRVALRVSRASCLKPFVFSIPKGMTKIARVFDFDEF